MKKRKLLILMVAAVFGFNLINCASVKDLTPDAIRNDIGGVNYLERCQFFLSKDVTLKYNDDSRYAGNIDESGTALVERVITRRTISIGSSTPGVLQSRFNTGKDLVGYYWHNRSDGGRDLRLDILFEDDDDNSIRFIAIYDIGNDKFELISDEIDYGGVPYTVTYPWEHEKPFLKYKLLERTVEQTESRRLQGRRVGTN